MNVDSPVSRKHRSRSRARIRRDPSSFLLFEPEYRRNVDRGGGGDQDVLLRRLIQGGEASWEKENYWMEAWRRIEYYLTDNGVTIVLVLALVCANVSFMVYAYAVVNHRKCIPDGRQGVTTYILTILGRMGGKTINVNLLVLMLTINR